MAHLTKPLNWRLVSRERSQRFWTKYISYHMLLEALVKRNSLDITRLSLSWIKIISSRRESKCMCSIIISQSCLIATTAVPFTQVVGQGPRSVCVVIPTECGNMRKTGEPRLRIFTTTKCDFICSEQIIVNKFATCYRKAVTHYSYRQYNVVFRWSVPCSSTYNDIHTVDQCVIANKTTRVQRFHKSVVGLQGTNGK